MASIAVLIAARNEARRISGAILSAWEAGAAEVIVADGSSSDDTSRVAREAGALVLEGNEPRGTRLNRAAERARAEVLVFLHADTILPPDACSAIEEALDRGTIFGGFRIRFQEPHRRLRVAAWLINWRTRLTRCPWGDQAPFIRRDLFFSSGRFLDAPIMEDYELSQRMKRLGPTEILALPVVTSGRRFLEKGLVRSMLLNWAIVVAWRWGATPDRLARWYRS